MKPELENIADQALDLSSLDRAYLAEILLESLDFGEDFPLSDEWYNEVRRRCRDIDSGKVELIDGETALNKIRMKYEIL